MPAAGTSPPYMLIAASCESSRNGVPGSSKALIRSRAKSLPRARCLCRASSDPPWATSASFCRRSSTRARIAPALARNSSLRTSRFDLIADTSHQHVRHPRAGGDPGHFMAWVCSESGTNNICGPVADRAPELIEKIVPLGIHLLDQAQFPRPAPFLELLLALDR